MQHNKMTFRKTLTYNASWQPFRHTQAKPKKVETHSTKFQPDEAFDAQQTLVEAGYRPRQAQGLLRVVGGVLKPLALQSSVLKLESKLESVGSKLESVDNKSTIVIVIVLAQIAADPKNPLRGMLASLLDLLKSAPGA